MPKLIVRLYVDFSWFTFEFYGGFMMMIHEVSSSLKKEPHGLWRVMRAFLINYSPTSAPEGLSVLMFTSKILLNLSAIRLFIFSELLQVGETNVFSFVL